MKKAEIDVIQDSLKNIQKIMGKQDYQTSSSVNQQIVRINPILKKEAEKLDTAEKITNCPKLYVYSADDVTLENTKKKLEESNKLIIENKKAMEDILIKNLNDKLYELYSNDCKIIDYGYLVSEIIPSVYIKYTY